jgi:glutaredoxin-related protein
MAKYTLFTTNCPKCKILEKKLKDKNVDFDTCEDVQKMQDLGITSVPVLSVENNNLSFYDAVKYINSL